MFVDGVAMGKKVRTKEGFLVDRDTGEVIDDTPLEAYGDVFWGSTSCLDEEAVEKFINRLIPGLVAILKLYLRKKLCESSLDEIENVLKRLWGSEAYSILGNVFREALRNRVDVYEARVYDIAGLPGLTVFRCLRKTGYNPENILTVFESENRGDRLGNLVYTLLNEVRNCRRNALIRWISRPLDDYIDIEYASTVLNSEIKSLGRLKYLVLKVDGLGVQITPNKVDISSKAFEYEKVLHVLTYLSRRLGVELSKPVPAIATIVVKLPFKVNIEILANHEKGEIQGSRAKIVKENYTLLVYPTTLNIYAKLNKNINRIDTVVAEALPTICTYIDKSSLLSST